MAVGGFNGTDPAPTLAQFQAARRRRQDPLLRRRRNRPWAAAARPPTPAAATTPPGSPQWVAGELRGHDRRRHHRLRPHRGRLVTDVAASGATMPNPRPDAQSTHRFATTAGQRRRPTLDDMSIDVAEPDLHPAQTPPPPTGRVVLDVVVPVYNEETDLEPSVRRLRRATWPRSSRTRYRITIADNASTDATPSIAAGAGRRARRRSTSVRLDEKGRGRALRAVWGGLGRAGARLLRRRPVDRPGRAAAAGRPADLRALRPRDRHPARPRVAGGPRRRSGSSSPAATTCCCAARCRPASPTPSAASRRSAPTSRGGCCRWSRTPAGSSTPRLLVLAERAGLRIHEVPVDWVDDPDSRVDIVATALADLRGIWRVGRALGLGRAAASPSCARSSAARRSRRACPGCRRRCRASWSGSPRSAWRAPSRTCCCSCCSAA